MVSPINGAIDRTFILHFSILSGGIGTEFVVTSSVTGELEMRSTAGFESKAYSIMMTIRFIIHFQIT